MYWNSTHAASVADLLKFACRFSGKVSNLPRICSSLSGLGEDDYPSEKMIQYPLWVKCPSEVDAHGGLQMHNLDAAGRVSQGAMFCDVKKKAA